MSERVYVEKMEIERFDWSRFRILGLGVHAFSTTVVVHSCIRVVLYDVGTVIAFLRTGLYNVTVSAKVLSCGKVIYWCGGWFSSLQGILIIQR